MKNYEEMAQLKVSESIQAGLAAQKRRLMLNVNQRHVELSPEQRDELFHRLFAEGRRSEIRGRRHSLSVLVYIALSFGLILAITAAIQGGLLP